MDEETQQADPVRWGVMSTAKIGVRAVIPAIAAASNARLVAIASRDTSRAQTIAANYPGSRALASYEALLDDDEIEAVYIPLPNSLHAEWAIRALEAGKHVLCEKPLGVTSDEVRRIRAASEQANRWVMEAFMYRFHPQIRWTLEQVAAGRIGAARTGALVVRLRFAQPTRRYSAPGHAWRRLDDGCRLLSAQFLPRRLRWPTARDCRACRLCRRAARWRWRLAPCWTSARVAWA